MDLTNKLKNIVHIRYPEPIVNEYGEIERNEMVEDTKKVYAQIIPMTTKRNDLNSESNLNVSQYKIIVRKKSIKTLDLNMQIRYRKLIFEVDYWNYDFKNNEYIELICSQVVQN